MTGLVEEHDFGGAAFDLGHHLPDGRPSARRAGTLARVRQLLTDRGLLFIDIVDFRAAYLRNWSVEDAIKIDHPYYLTERDDESYLRGAGFEIARTRLRGGSSARQLHLPPGCRRAKDALPDPRRRCATCLREIRFVQNTEPPAGLTGLMPNVLGLVPARGGSKGVPGKNIRPLRGRPLLEYTARAAQASGVIDRLVLSTDSAEIAEVGRRAGLEAPFLRPAALAADDTPMLPVVRHALDALADGRMDAQTSSCILQPTSPLRRAEHVRDAVAMLRETGADSVVTVVEVPRHLSPDYVMKIEEGRLRHFLPEGARVARRQDARQAYSRDGTVYACWVRTIDRFGTIYGDDCRPLGDCCARFAQHRLAGGLGRGRADVGGSLSGRDGPRAAAASAFAAMAGESMARASAQRAPRPRPARHGAERRHDCRRAHGSARSGSSFSIGCHSSRGLPRSSA